jgi:hypothetical protein
MFRTVPVGLGGSSIMTADQITQLQMLAQSGIQSLQAREKKPAVVPDKSVAVMEKVPDLKLDPETEQYLKIAEKAGVTAVIDQIQAQRNAELSKVDAIQKRNEFRAFLSENGICVYEHGKVASYMASITPDGYTWVWKYAAGPLDDKIGKGNRYSQPIPMPVLMTMATIREKYPEAIFEVTEIVQQPKLDPFLRVSVASSEITRSGPEGGEIGDWSQSLDIQRLNQLSQFQGSGRQHSPTGIAREDYFIIERWDEPGFRM